MLLTEIRDMVATGAIQAKEKVCRKRPDDIHPTIDAFRGGDPVATLLLKGSKANFIEAFAMVAAGYEADQIGVVMDTYTTGPNLERVGINPVTGEEFDNTTLSDLFLNHDGAAKGWVRECLFVQVYNRAGDMIAARLPHHYVGGRHLVWDERENIPEDLIKKYPDDDPEGWHATGGMADPMRAFMNDVPSFSQVFPGIVTEEATRAEMDVAVTQAIQRRMPSHIILWALQGGEETLKRRMGRG